MRKNMVNKKDKRLAPYHNAVRPKNADRAMQRIFVPMEDESCKDGYREWGNSEKRIKDRGKEVV
jgi:hypothetical protein